MNINEMLLSAPASQLDQCIKDLVKLWDTPATALQILEVLDMCIHGGLCSGFVVKLLEIELDLGLKKEGITLQCLAQRAIWRKEVTE